MTSRSTRRLLMHHGLDKEVTRILQSFGDPSTTHLIAIASSESQSEEDRSQAIYVVGLLRLRGATDALLSAFRSRSRILPWRAAVALGQIGSRAATRPLMHILKQAENPISRRAAAYALGLLYDSRAIPTLARIVRSPQEPADLRGEAAEALGTCGFGSRVAASVLAEVLSSEEPEVRFFAAHALGVCGDQQSIPALEKLLVDRVSLPGYGAIAEEAHASLVSIRSRLK